MQVNYMVYGFQRRMPMCFQNRLETDPGKIRRIGVKVHEILLSQKKNYKVKQEE